MKILTIIALVLAALVGWLLAGVVIAAAPPGVPLRLIGAAGLGILIGLVALPAVVRKARRP